MSKQIAQTEGKGGKSDKPVKPTVEVRVQKQTVTPKWTSGKPIPCVYNGDKNLKGAISIVVASARGIRDFTIHRPIGRTALSANDWVMSETPDVTLLLERADHPDESRIKIRRAQRLKDILVGEYNFSIVNDDLHYPDGTNRDQVVRAARAEARTSAASSTPTRKAEPGEYLLHLSDAARVSENAYSELVKCPYMQSRLERDVPLPHYVTMAGVNQDKHQRLIPFASGIPDDRIQDFLTKEILTTLHEPQVQAERTRTTIDKRTVRGDLSITYRDISNLKSTGEATMQTSASASSSTSANTAVLPNPPKKEEAWKEVKGKKKR